MESKLKGRNLGAGGDGAYSLSSDLNAESNAVTVSIGTSIYSVTPQSFTDGETSIPGNYYCKDVKGDSKGYKPNSEGICKANNGEAGAVVIVW